MVGVTPLDRATLSLVVFRPRPRHVRSIVFTKLIVIVRFFWFVVWMWFTALQVGNIKQGWKNPDHSLSSITFLIQLSIKLGTFHLMIGQCHAIIKCKGIHKSQLQSWRRNTFLCHRLERAFFWWPSSMFITTPSPWNTCPVPSSLSAIAPEKKCEMCVTLVTIASYVTELRRHRGRVTRPCSRGYCHWSPDHDGYLRNPGSPVWTIADNEEWSAANNQPWPAATKWRIGP